ncbi:MULTISPECIES: nitronate monooxygenase family protein [unclassified Bacillus (in: firmicutes)]|uniref:NAD(P)H-dependent flavin oxidoreductase n=1 Tax=unclassified Bacillus (in: firmicutes) TaxID=185979 RepID=UPI0008E88578|nr:MULTISPECIES: nitronate monooxygenase [unclassified Bacillus (in: firmicutes)]SFA88467.1 enoyl-[acyl-carrier protein] reductase II [Bacillus sp. UNCCL13]SFQ84620.1 enoyl-[acyl-carrier protein] reductase II [Bacillus sp. cl95]
MNELTTLLNIKYPIFQGGMGNISNSQLTAAVSEAGGLGTIGAGTMSPEQVERIIIETKTLTSKPFALNIALSVSPHVIELLKLVVKHHVQVVSLSAGNPAPYIGKLHEHGVKVISVVASVRQAIKAESAGVDVIVAEGYEAAGINSPIETTTLTLIPQVVDAVQIPVVAAGGIADGRGLAAMLVLGAKGIQMGTRFIATKEAPFHDEYKQKLIASDDTGTVIVGRSVGKIRRVMRTEYADHLLSVEKFGINADDFQALTTEDVHRIGALEGNGEKGFMNGGQISGLIKDIPTVAELLEEMVEIAKQKVRFE